MQNKGNLMRTVRIIILTMMVMFLVMSFMITLRVFVVDGKSMSPTIKERETVLVIKHPIDINSGDIVVYNSNPYSDTNKEPAVKRVVGVGGDIISYNQGVLFVNGVEMRQYSNPETDTRLDHGLIQLGNGEMWLIGDNLDKDASIDSRVQGKIMEKDVIGKVIKIGKE